MATATMTYLGDLRVECKHEQSGTIIYTDAPVDNNGQGRAFSPTDLCAASLASCALTIMGMYANTHKVDIVGARAEVTKTMGTSPRSIAKLEVTFIMPDKKYTDKEKTSLQRAAATCPVKLTLEPNVELVVTYKWADA